MRISGISTLSLAVLLAGCGGSVGNAPSTGDDAGDSAATDASPDDTATADTTSDDSASAETSVTDSASAETSDDAGAADTSADATSGDADEAGMDAVADTGTDAADLDASDATPSCDDMNPCTTDSFSGGGCVHTPVADGTACDDGNACNGQDRCQAGTCVAGHPGAVHDDFSETALDASLWTANTNIPQGNASVTLTGGHVVLTNRAHLVSAKTFDPTQGAVRVTAEWTFDPSGGFDFLSFLTRSDGVPGGAYGETNSGVACIVDMNGNLTLQQSNSGSTFTTLASDTLGGAPGTDTLQIEIFDDGTNVTCSARDENTGARATVTGVPTGSFLGNFVVFHNRENSDGSHTGTLDNVTIEPGVGSRPSAQWTFDDVSPTKALDWAGTADGIVASGAQKQTSVMGYGTDAQVFGNAMSYVDFGSSLGSLHTSDFTLSFWMNAPSTSSPDILGNRDSSSGGQYLGIRLGSTGVLGAEIYGNSAPGGALASGTAIATSTWHHVVLERQGATLTWFVDGIQTATGPVNGVPDIASSANFLFGKSPFNDGYTNYATGSIDDLRLYGRALPLCEVRNVYGIP